MVTGLSSVRGHDYVELKHQTVSVTVEPPPSSLQQCYSEIVFNITVLSCTNSLRNRLGLILIVQPYMHCESRSFICFVFHSFMYTCVYTKNLQLISLGCNIHLKFLKALNRTNRIIWALPLKKKM